MADNTTLSVGAGGDTIATDDIGGVKYPRSKITLGADGATDGDVSSANPMPVKGTGAAGTANSGVVTVQGIASMTPILATVTNAGTFATQVSGDALTALQLIDNPVLVDDAAFTPASSYVMMAGFQADEASIDSVDEGDCGAARMTLDRKVIVNPQPHTAGGTTIFRSLDLDETEEDVKTSAGCLYGGWASNTNASARYLKFYNATAANVTVGASTPVMTIYLPASSTTSLNIGGIGVTFDTAICVAATTGVADADTGAPSANDIVVNLLYK